MDVDEEIQPDEDENSHLSVGVMSDIHEDDADQSMNSEDQLNENSNSLDHGAVNPLSSNVASEIDSTVEASQLPSSSVMILNHEDFQNEDTMTLNQKGTENNSDGKDQIEDIQMESSNMSPKLDDDNTYMSTDMRECIESPSSDVSMSSEREIHSPVTDNGTSNIGLNNLNNEVTFISTTKLDDNLVQDCKSSDVELQDSGVSQIDKKIKVHQVERNITSDDAHQQREYDSSLLKHDDRLEECSSENLHTIQDIKDTNLNASHTLKIDEESDDKIIENSDLNPFSIEQQLSHVNKNKDSFQLSEASVNISDVIPISKDKLNENSDLSSKGEEENLTLEELNSNSIMDLHEKEESEIKTQKDSECETSKNNICNKEKTGTKNVSMMPVEDNFNNQIKNSIKKSIDLEIPKTQVDSLQTQGSTSKTEIENNVKLLDDEYTGNVSEEAMRLSVEEKIKTAEMLEECPENFAETEETVKNDNKKNATVLDECSEKLTEETGEIVIENAAEDEQDFDKSSHYFTEKTVQPVMNEEVKKDLTTLEECSDTLLIMDKGDKSDSNVLGKDTDDIPKKINEDVIEEIKNEAKGSDECSENMEAETPVLSEQLENSNILNKNTDDFTGESQVINIEEKILDECSDEFTKVEKKNVTNEEIINKSQSNSHESNLQESSKNDQREKKAIDSDNDSNSYIDISEYLINLKKKDYFSTPDLLSEDSMSNQKEENSDEEKNSDIKSPTEAELESPENNNKFEDIKDENVQKSPGKHNDTNEIQESKECDDNKTPIKIADNCDTLQLTKENESQFEVVDEVCEEDTKKKQRKLITTEGLAKSSSKCAFIEEPGRDIEDGSFTRVVIVGDSYISTFIKLWPENSKIRPYFLYKDNITLSQITRFKIHNHPYLKDSEKIFVLFICGLHELCYYSTYKFHGCHGSHSPFKYVKKVENDSKSFHRYIKDMTILKKKIEISDGVYVSFSYLPVIDLVNISHEVSQLCRSKSFDCSCNFSVGTSASVESINSIHNINQSIFYRNLNENKINGIFEFSPVNITFYLDRWCIYSKKLKLKENSDILDLSYLLEQYVYDIKPKIAGSDNEMCLPATLHSTISDASRILIIGDTWMKYVAENWNEKSDVKPYFYCKNGLTLNCIQKVITSLTRMNTKLLIITAIPSGEFFVTSKFSECKDHTPLEYPIPNELMLKDPSSFAEYVSKKLDLLSLNVHANKLSKIVFFTCYPAFFKSYYKSLYEKHVKCYSSHDISKSLEDMHDCSEFDTKVEHCFKKINRHAAALNKEIKIPTCNIFSLIEKVATHNMSVFPTEARSLSGNIQKKLLELFEKYSCNLHTKNNTNYESKFDDKNANKESISDVILKCSDICVKIENKPIDVVSIKSSSTEPSESNRVVLLKERKDSFNLDKNLVHSTEIKSKRNRKSFMESKDGRDKFDSRKPCYPIESYFRERGPRRSYNMKYSTYDDDLTSDRYESYSKHSREFPLHGRKRSYTRSRSKERRRSRSRSYVRRYSRDRSKDKTYYRKRSIERKRSGRSTSRDKKRYRSRSRSRSSIKKHSRSSRSPHRKRHRSKEYNSSKSGRTNRSKSPTRSSDKRELSRELGSVENEAVASLWETHTREREMYRKHPENHPDHDRVKRMWLDIMNSQGLNTYDPSVLQCWWEYWLKKMEELLEASWEEKKQKCLSLLFVKSNTSKLAHSSDSSSSSSDNYGSSKKKKRSKSKKSKTKMKSLKRSPSESKLKDELYFNDDVPSSVEEMERVLQDFVNKNRENKSHELISKIIKPVEETPKKMVTKSNTSKESEKLLDIMSILCQISNKFGALGMSLTVLYQKAVECVKNDLSPYNCIDEDAKMLLDLISDKIKKLLSPDSDLTLVQRTIVQEANDRLLPFLESFESSKDLNINIESLANATLGLQASEIIGFIRADLAFKGHKKLSNDDLGDLYLQVKTYQMKALSEKKHEKKKNILEFSMPSSSRTSSSFSSSSFRKENTLNLEDLLAIKKLF